MTARRPVRGRVCRVLRLVAVRRPVGLLAQFPAPLKGELRSPPGARGTARPATEYPQAAVKASGAASEPPERRWGPPG
ncbi:hypothetical protein C1N81_28000 [Streptomyces sp. SGAir0957]